MYRRSLSILFTTLLMLPLAGCQVEQTEEGELPEVEVEAQEGEMPEYDVETGEIEVETETETVEVPDVDVETEEEQVEVPTDVDVEYPDEEPDAEETDEPN